MENLEIGGAKKPGALLEALFPLGKGVGNALPHPLHPTGEALGQVIPAKEEQAKRHNIEDHLESRLGLATLSECFFFGCHLGHSDLALLHRLMTTIAAIHPILVGLGTKFTEGYRTSPAASGSHFILVFEAMRLHNCF